jgi:integration host factor subunit alpha
MDQGRPNKKPGLVKAAPSVGPAIKSPDKSFGKAVGKPSAPPVKTITRVELLDAVYTACPSLSRAQARDIFEMTLEEIVGALLRDDSVKLRSFGAFNLRSKRARIGRNPRTGVEAVIIARRVVTFKASPSLIARVNGLDAPDDNG